jgi:hypothetical protein
MFLAVIISKGGRRHGYEHQSVVVISNSDDSEYSDRDTDSYYEERETWKDDSK